MKKIRTWQLCRTGTFGQDGAKITEKDLKDIVETFTPTRPISIGHDSAKGDNFPKFGDVLAIDGIYDDAKHKGEKVLVGMVMLHPELEKQFSDKDDGDGCYKGWSVTIPNVQATENVIFTAWQSAVLFHLRFRGLSSLWLKAAIQTAIRLRCLTSATQ